MSGSITTNIHKPNLLRHTNYMFECGQRLNEDREYDSDSILLTLVSARQIDQAIYDNFHADQQLDLSIDDPNTFFQLQLLKTQLKNWRRDLHVFDYRLSMFCIPSAVINSSLYK